MHFISETRYNPAKGCDDSYYRIKESYRDVSGRSRTRIMLNIGFMSDRPRPEDLRDIGKCLSYMFSHNGDGDGLFGSALCEYNETVQSLARKYWDEMVARGSVDTLNKSIWEDRRKAEKLVEVDTMKHTDVREIGAEWLCLQAIRELELDKFLLSEGWGEVQINTALALLITRTIYTSSELRSMSIMDENSAVCELLSGNQEWRPGFHSIYEVAPSLFAMKDKIEEHLCRRTDDLFNLNNRLVLYDLTNFYFEGQKSGSEKAKFGRSKEKRSDCRLLVLALCINEQGFIRYSSILAGNTADPNSLPDMIDTIAEKNRVPKDSLHKTLVVMDAGISTEENLKKIAEKGYDYLCVSRSRLTEYDLSPDSRGVCVYDTKRQPIKLTKVKHEDGGDYYLEINSPSKALKESSMNRQFKQRFEDEMGKIKSSLSKPHGKKAYEKVVERVGRAKQKYPSISRYYVIDYIRSADNSRNMGDIQWRIAVPENVDRNSGIYFLRTNRPDLDEKTAWDYYNLTREIECSNRQLKLDLNLRPIYHQKDDRSDAHLFLGLLSYWIVNTIRYQLKQEDEPCYWTEIVRRMSTQKVVTTTAVNALGEKVKMRMCSEPTKSVQEIYDKLKYKNKPFTKIKVCSTQ